MGRVATATIDVAFDQFWAVYPRHVAKQQALKAWRQLAPSAEEQRAMFAALVWQRHLPQWKCEDWIPYPGTWLRGRRWEDEPPKALRLVQGWGYRCTQHDPSCESRAACTQRYLDEHRTAPRAVKA